MQKKTILGYLENCSILSFSDSAYNVTLEMTHLKLLWHIVINKRRIVSKYFNLMFYDILKPATHLTKSLVQ